MNILHITTHMGGGAGHAISDLAVHDNKNSNCIVLLQKPEKTKYMDVCMENGIKVFTEISIDKLSGLMESADIVIIHWWQHPVMCGLLHDFPEIPVRLILWSHVSGCTYPMISYRFADKFAKIFFTSKYSLENPNWPDSEREKIYGKSEVIYGLGELSLMHPKCDYGIKNDVVKIGYTGTLAKSKIHPEFPDICWKILARIPNSEFYLLGDMESGAWIKDRLQKLGIEDKVHFEGYVDNVNEWLADFDIFGYPLNPYHFATTENSILEAMSAGLPVVLLNQATEKYIVTHNEDGILANGISDYADAIAYLAKNEQARKRLGMNAAKNVYEKFSFDNNLFRFQNGAEAAVLLDPVKVSFRDVMGDEAYDWFLSAVSETDRSILEKCQYDKLQPIFTESSKSSIVHFADSYPEDVRLHLLKIRG